jgi:hypothetical protein
MAHQVLLHTALSGFASNGKLLLMAPVLLQVASSMASVGLLPEA